MSDGGGPEWTEAIRQGDHDLLAGELATLLRSGRERADERTTAPEILGAFGRTPREQKTNAAIALSGSSDKSSRAYLSGRRSVERAVTQAKERRGARGLTPTMRKLRDLIPAPAGSIIERGLRLQMQARVWYRSADRHGYPSARVMPVGRLQKISGARLRATAGAWRKAETTDAGRELLNAFTAAYGLATGDVGMIEWASLEWGDE